MAVHGYPGDYSSKPLNQGSSQKLDAGLEVQVADESFGFNQQTQYGIDSGNKALHQEVAFLILVRRYQFSTLLTSISAWLSLLHYQWK